MSSGTGDIAKLFLKHIKNKGTVYAVDPNSKMLEIAKRKLGKYKNIKWYLGSAEKLIFKENYFDYYSISFGLRNTNNIGHVLQEAYLSLIHISEPTRLGMISYAVFCLKKKC